MANAERPNHEPFKRFEQPIKKLLSVPNKDVHKKEAEPPKRSRRKPA